MLAIEKNQPTIVNFLLELGANPAICDANGNNVHIQ
jgi:ankyrin repeat protein